ncbi:hypothetical protein SM033_00270 [Vibrio phage vB_VpaM_sm033]|nr:hypothetical protein SM033_00270 [Vibrio phage vB_VpaM_sm033]
MFNWFKNKIMAAAKAVKEFFTEGKFLVKAPKVIRNNVSPLGGWKWSPELDEYLTRIEDTYLGMNEGTVELLIQELPGVFAMKSISNHRGMRVVKQFIINQLKQLVAGDKEKTSYLNKMEQFIPNKETGPMPESQKEISYGMARVICLYFNEVPAPMFSNNKGAKVFSLLKAMEQ